MKKINIYNTTNRHNLDKVSCYERPVSDVMNYINPMCGDLFIIISKIYDLFKADLEDSTREKTAEFCEQHMGIKFNIVNKFSAKRIADLIENDIPVIVCGNLREVFFTTYYKKNNWPHWFLVKGYDSDTGVFEILDNVHFSVLGRELEDFKITKGLLKKANRGYQKVYDNVAFMYIQENDKYKYISTLEDVIKLYLSYDKTDETIYTQKKILENILELESKNDTRYESVLEGLKKKLANINKYKEVIAIEISRHLQIYGYDEKAQELLELGKSNAKLWTNYTLRTLVDISKEDCHNITIPDKIIDNETCIDTLINEILPIISRDYNQINEQYTNIYISNKKSRNSGKNEPNDIFFIRDEESISGYGYIMENNNDIIEVQNGKLIFEFYDGETYNWWLEDEAPKVIIRRENMTNKKISLRCKIKIDNNNKNNNTEAKYQAGIYVRNTNDKNFDNAYLGAFDNNGNFILSQIGETEETIPQQLQKEYELCMTIENNTISYSLLNNNTEEHIASIEYNNIGMTEIGLTCKTWGKYNKLNIQFSQVKYNHGV